MLPNHVGGFLVGSVFFFRRTPLKVLIDDFRARVCEDKSLSVILGIDEQHPCVKAFPKVLEAQQKMAKEDKNIAFTSMVGFEKADGTHLTPRGLEEHGARLFAAYKHLTKNSWDRGLKAVVQRSK